VEKAMNSLLRTGSIGKNGRIHCPKNSSNLVVFMKNIFLKRLSERVPLAKSTWGKILNPKAK